MAGFNRRQTIIGLGALAGGVGAIVGSGAFTTVEAQRNVDIETAGDADALLQLAVDGMLAADDGDVIALEQANLNVRALTTFDLTLYAALSDGVDVAGHTVDIYDAFDGDSITFDSRQDEPSDPAVQFVANDGASSGVSFDDGAATFIGTGDVSDPDNPTGDYAVYDFVVNLLAHNDVDDADDAIDAQIGDDIVIEVTSD